MRGRVVVVVGALGLLLARPAVAGTVNDPATWTNRRLAAQLVVASVSMGGLGAAESWVRAGVGGVVLLGSPPAATQLHARLMRLRSLSVPQPLVASDEEGGLVQRLTSVIYRLPSAESMGRHWTTAQVRARATDYGARMRALGVDVNLSPVADLSIAGHYIERLDRGFSADPAKAAAYVVAWQDGMAASHVAAVVKHWPGHGQASDTHAGAATTPHLSVLQQRDLVPFRASIVAGVPAVMVGHLKVPGLTSGGVPASLSQQAYRYLRARAAPSTVLMTDSLSMRAVTTALGLTPAEAAVRALRAGADVALVDGDPMGVVARVQRALDTGEYSRPAAVVSVKRLLMLKRLTTPPRLPTSLTPADAAVTSLRPALSGIVNDSIGGTLTARFFIRKTGSPTYDIVNGAAVSVPAGARASYTVAAGKLAYLTEYEWQLRACNAAAYCSPLTPARSFTTSPAP